MARLTKAISSRHSAWAVVGVVVALCVWAWQPWQPSPRESVAAARVPVAMPVDATEQYGGKRPVLDPVPVAEPPSDRRSLVLGRWSDEFYGHRTLTFQDDGTATMEIELDPVGRLIYGPKLMFFVRWSLEGDTLHLHMAGGEPAEATKTLAKVFGETSQQRIVALDAQEMRLRSLDSQKLYTHKRVTNVVDNPTH